VLQAVPSEFPSFFPKAALIFQGVRSPKKLFLRKVLRDSLLVLFFCALSLSSRPFSFSERFHGMAFLFFTPKDLFFSRVKILARVVSPSAVRVSFFPSSFLFLVFLALLDTGFPPPKFPFNQSSSEKAIKTCFPSSFPNRPFFLATTKPSAAFFPYSRAV